MRRFLVVLSLVAITNAVNVSKNYHLDIGIPTATRIKEAEDKILAGGSRIIGGNEARPNAHPYLVGLIITFWNNPGQSACGSVLVSANRLVTAAHCYDVGQLFVRQFEAVLGSHFLFSGGTRIVSNRVVIHPSWDWNTLFADIAMVYLPTSVGFSATIQPATLPRNNLGDSFEGQIATASGWGQTRDAQSGVSFNAVVSYVNLRVISVRQCQAVFGPVFVQSSTICTDGTGIVGICYGDSGGPLVIKRNGENILVGISSFIDYGGCEAGGPSAYARVTSFYNFIIQHL